MALLPSSKIKKPTYKLTKRIPRPKKTTTKTTKPKKKGKETSDFVYYPPAGQGRPPNPRTRNDTAVKFGRKTGTALSDALDDAMPHILAGDYEAAYSAVLAKIKGQMLDTLNRTLGNYGFPPVDESGPDNEYWLAAVRAKSGLDIQDLSLGGLKDYGEKVLWAGIGKSLNIDLQGCTGVDDAVDRFITGIEQGNIRTSVILTNAMRQRAEVAKALKDTGKTWQEYQKALNRRNSSEYERDN